MKSKVILGIVFTVLFVGMLPLAFKIQRVEASGTIYIKADGSIDPPTANITSPDNITYTFTGNVNDSIVVERHSIVVDGSGYTLQGPGSGNGFYLNGRSNVTIKNTIVKGWTVGIRAYYSSGNTIDNNTVTSNSNWGIMLYYYSNGNIVSGNTVTSNSEAGIITMLHSNNNTVSGNEVTLNGIVGIVAQNYSCSNTISNNNVTSNGRWGIVIQHDSSGNIVSGNNVTSNEYVGIILFYHSDGNTVSGNEVTLNWRGGIVAGNYSCSNTISNNNVTSNGEHGIALYDHSGNNNITGNTATSNGKTGIVTFFECHDNIIVDNRVWNNSWSAIYLRISGGNTLRNNNMTRNKYNFAVYSDLNRVSDYVQDIDTSNTVNGKPIYYWMNQHDRRIPADAGCVHAVNCVNITVEDLNLTKNGAGVRFVNTTDSTIRNVTALNNNVGISLFLSSGNTINGSTLISVGYYRNSTDQFWGPPRWMPGCGIGLLNSSSNTMSGNTITNNDLGISLLNCSSNTIYHNNFINNTVQANVTSEYVNTWDDDYPSGGNYWSDYEDRYPDAEELNDLGIWNTSYFIEENNQDNYPLMGPWTVEGKNVTVIPSSDVTMTFENVTSEGITTLNTTQVGPEPPSGFKLAAETPTYYDIETTASYSGTIEISIAYNDTGLTEQEENALRLMQWNETLQQWIDITTYVDTESNIIHGETSHLSNFAIMLSTAAVGGIYVPVNKLELLVPYIGLTILLAVAIVTVVYVRKRKRNTEINS